MAATVPKLIKRDGILCKFQPVQQHVTTLVPNTVFIVDPQDVSSIFFFVLNVEYSIITHKSLFSYPASLWIKINSMCLLSSFVYCNSINNWRDTVFIVGSSHSIPWPWNGLVRFSMDLSSLKGKVKNKLRWPSQICGGKFYGSKSKMATNNHL